MIPDMTNVLTAFEQDVTITTTTQTIVDFKPVLTDSDVETRAVVQVASADVLKALNIDSSQSLYQIHSKYEMKNNDILKGYKDIELRIIKTSNYSEYGYYEVIGEEIK